MFTLKIFLLVLNEIMNEEYQVVFSLGKIFFEVKYTRVIYKESFCA